MLPKTIGNRKRLSVSLRSGDKHHLRKPADRKAQIRSVSGTNAFLLCFSIFIFSQVVFIPRAQTHAQSRKGRHHCRAKIGDEFTLSHAKNSHNWRWAYTFLCQKFALFDSPFTLPVSSFTERSPWLRWNSQWVHTFHCQKFFRPQALFPLFQMARAARQVIETQDKWSNPAQSYFVLPIEKLNQINTKNYWK